MKKLTLSAAAAALLALAAPAMACQGNMCSGGNNFGVVGGGYGVSGFDAGGQAENWGSGDLVARGAFNESGGEAMTTFSFDATTCPAEGCDNQVTVGGSGFSFNRGGSFIETTGGSAGSWTGGDAISGGEAGAWTSRLRSGHGGH